MLYMKFLRVVLFFVFLEIFFQLGAPASRLYYSLKERSSLNQHDVYRIMCLGESITFNGGEDSFPSQLERLLNVSEGKKRFVVINKGIPGKTTNELLGIIDSILDDYHPDLVVAMLGIHDVVFEQTVKKDWISRVKIDILGKFKTYLLIRDLKSMLRSHIEAKKKNERNGEQGNEFLEAPKGKNNNGILNDVFDSEHEKDGRDRLHFLLNPHPLTVRNYNEMIGKMLNRNIKVFVMQYPMVSVTPLEKMVREKDKVVFISNEENFLKAMKSHKREDLFLDVVGGTFGHCTPLGSRIIAENLSQRILDFLRENRERE